jgi:hypothetical protein
MAKVLGSLCFVGNTWGKEVRDRAGSAAGLKGLACSFRGHLSRQVTSTFKLAVSWEAIPPRKFIDLSWEGL